MGKKPVSTKQRKAQLQEKRAIKRGDIPPPPPDSKQRSRRPKPPGHGPLDPAQEDRIASARKLQSSFLKPSPEFLAHAKLLASTVPLPRPVPEEARYAPEELIHVPDDLTCPKRPKWRYDMAKKEVDANEQRIFTDWQEGTLEKIQSWRGVGTGEADNSEDPSQVKSISYFEQNLEVWRQLWRVTEISSILLVLLDSRCPPLHIPPSLHNYITKAIRGPPRQIIFVLTKSGVVGEECATAWKAWLEDRYGKEEIQVVMSESYRPKESEMERKGQGSRRRNEPHIPSSYLSSLISAIQMAHQRLLTPPPHIANHPDPERRRKWRPRVRESVNWDALKSSLPTTGNDTNDAEVVLDGNDLLDDDSDDEAPGENEDGGPVLGPLTIGLIGQPNVGKSSLLNALFGKAKVKASRTPGKTKHFQTLFWSPEIRLVDCPGLVLPSYVPMEIQALCSILPISQIPSLPSCIRYLGTIMPLEKIFNLTHPALSSSSADQSVADKRTWRTTDNKPTPPKEKKLEWTAMDIMTAYADKKGWVTAKAARPDIMRAGNAILRSVAENRIRWAFWPPVSKDVATTPRTHTEGVWIPDPELGDVFEEEYERSEDESERRGERTASDDLKGGSEGDKKDSSESDDEGTTVETGRGMFGLLDVDGDSEETSHDED